MYGALDHIDFAALRAEAILREGDAVGAGREGGLDGSARRRADDGNTLSIALEFDQGIGDGEVAFVAEVTDEQEKPPQDRVVERAPSHTV